MAKLKNKAENEKNPEKLIAILEEMDDLLFNLEMRIAAQNESMHSRTNSAHDPIATISFPTFCQVIQKGRSNE